ncbi:MAG TPA: hypothetical protein VKH43_04665 [Thermoanaerobaculia bacterium]|nr:hypothetical protein [Thermoanaerobaculia bacterium]
MKKTGTGFGLAIVILVWCGGMLISRNSAATLDMQKKAKAAGFPATSCTYCHNEKTPKKGASTYNERGQWLEAEKQKHKAKHVDVHWLKDYPGDKAK